MTQIAIIGPGAVGGVVAAWLSQPANHQVMICARTGFERLEVETPHGRLEAAPQVFTDPAQVSPVDFVLAATKAYDVAAVAPWLASLVGAKTVVAVLQNGVEQVERFAPFLPIERILPVVVECPAERSAPGRMRQRGAAWLKVPDTSAGRSFRELFLSTQVAVHLTPDFVTAAWTKLCLNCAGAVSAVTLKPAGVVRVPEIAEVMRSLIRECILVGRAEGAQLPDNLLEMVIDGYLAAPEDAVNSLHADRLAGRPMEIDARNGVIVRRAAKHGLKAPMNEAMVALLKAVDLSSSTETKKAVAQLAR